MVIVLETASGTIEVHLPQSAKHICYEESGMPIVLIELPHTNIVVTNAKIEEHQEAEVEEETEESQA